jgi:PadR family transcriptional regulator PadR
MLLLTVLAAGPAHGYALSAELRHRSGDLLVVMEGSLYPALHRLEEGGLVKSSWESGDGRRRRQYALTPKGRKALKQEVEGWVEFRNCVDAIVKELR